MKSDELELEENTTTDASPFAAKADDLLVMSGFDRQQPIPVTVEPGTSDLQTIQQVIVESPKAVLAKSAGLVTAPSRDARYRLRPS